MPGPASFIADDPMRRLLLDTCAVIFHAQGEPMKKDALSSIRDAAAVDGVLISPVSAWEIGMLANPSRKQPMRFDPDPKAWFAYVCAEPGAGEAPLTNEIAIEASVLPGPLHGDPADRLLIATARTMNVPIVTRDKKMIAYGRRGHVRVIPC